MAAVGDGPNDHHSRKLGMQELGVRVAPTEAPEPGRRDRMRSAAKCCRGMQGRRKGNARHQTSAKSCAALCPKIVTPYARRRETNRSDHVAACKVGRTPDRVIPPPRAPLSPYRSHVKRFSRKPTRRLRSFAKKLGKIGGGLVRASQAATAATAVSLDHLQARRKANADWGRAADERVVVDKLRQSSRSPRCG
jgi:hypothetical protein